MSGREADERTRSIYEQAGRVVENFALVDDALPMQLRDTDAGRAFTAARSSARRSYEMARAAWGRGEYTLAANTMSVLARTIRAALALAQSRGAFGESATLWAEVRRRPIVAAATRSIEAHGRALDSVLAAGASLARSAAGGLGFGLAMVAAMGALYLLSRGGR